MVGIAIPLLALVVIQPDLGTASVLAFGWLVCLWLSPINKRYLMGMVGVVALIAVLVWLIMEPYQKARLTTFLNPSASPLGAGYNVLQSQIAVGSGHWFGQGWGRGTQSHLNFLPEHHTDFIFASLSEEFGFVGALVVVLLYGIILWRGLRLAWRARDRTTVILASGITLTLLFQALVNMAMNVGLAPVTGIPLPLVSYGGSSLLTTICSIAVLESISLQEDYRR
jgi:rod shape determining protein RodA